MEPCEPAWSCLGNNTCEVGYTGSRCAQCERGKYFRINGECEKCPDSPYLVLAFLGAAAVVAAAVGWVLNRKQVNIAFMSIGVDYFQVLAMFANARVRWPPLIRNIM